MRRLIKIAAWFAVSSGLVYWFYQRRQLRGGVVSPNRHTEQWDVVDEASWESFPASDPPAYH